MLRWRKFHDDRHLRNTEDRHEGRTTALVRPPRATDIPRWIIPVAHHLEPQHHRSRDTWRALHGDAARSSLSAPPHLEFSAQATGGHHGPGQGHPTTGGVGYHPGTPRHQRPGLWDCRRDKPPGDAVFLPRVDRLPAGTSPVAQTRRIRSLRVRHNPRVSEAKTLTPFTNPVDCDEIGYGARRRRLGALSLKPTMVEGNSEVVFNFRTRIQLRTERCTQLLH